MLWRIPLEVVFALALLFAGGSFWSCLKAPAHLRKLLAEPSGLERIIGLIGYDTLYADAQNIKPLIGSYGENITLWDIAHLKSLSQTRNLFGLACGVILSASWLLGFWYFTVSVVIFFLLGTSELPAAAKNNNARHLASVTLNLIKWSQVDDQACAVFCRQQRPEYQNLYQILSSLRTKATQPSE